jgi:hypothetical protein
MASDPKFSDWYFAFSKEHNRTPSQEEVWKGALASREEPATPPAAIPAAPSELTLIERVSELMRGIDAYAYDYRADGKLAASRHAVSNALLAAFNADLLKLIRTQPITVQQAEPSDVQMEQIADAIWGAQKKRLPMSAAIEFARAVLALKTAQTTALPGGNGEGE